jgi:hypothetical protein
MDDRTIPIAGWAYISEDPLDGGEEMLSGFEPKQRQKWPLVRLSDALGYAATLTDAQCDSILNHLAFRYLLAVPDEKREQMREVVRAAAIEGSAVRAAASLQETKQ